MNSRFRKTVLFSSLVLAFPVSSQAATEEQALDACAKALVSDLGDSQGSPVSYHIGDGSSNSSASLRGYSTFHLDASNPKTSEVVAKVDCTVNSSGEVIKMKMLHLNALSAAQRSKLKL